MKRRYRIAATLTTLAAATTLSLAATGTASAQDDALIASTRDSGNYPGSQNLRPHPSSEHDDALWIYSAVEEAQEDAEEIQEAHEDAVEEEYDDYDVEVDLYQVDW